MLEKVLHCSKHGHANQKARQELHRKARGRLQLADLARRFESSRDRQKLLLTLISLHFSGEIVPLSKVDSHLNIESANGSNQYS
jgi:hypothetical protein